MIILEKTLWWIVGLIPIQVRGCCIGPRQEGTKSCTQTVADRQWREDRFDKISGRWAWWNGGGWGKERHWGWCLTFWLNGLSMRWYYVHIQNSIWFTMWTKMHRCHLMITDSDCLWEYCQYISKHCWNTPQAKWELTLILIPSLWCWGAFSSGSHRCIFSEPFMLPYFLDGPVSFGNLQILFP